jgi:GNAT superfamily N-acetyltransferase
VAACFGHSQTDQAINIINNAAHPRSDARDSITTARAFPDTSSAGADALREVTPVCLLDFFVHHSVQRQGWGRLMLDAARLWAVSEAARILWLEVRVGNARAIKVYQSHGFEVVGQRKAYYAAGRGQREDALVMRLQLPVVQTLSKALEQI